MYKTNVPTELNRHEFLKIFGGVYEHSQWIAEKIYDAGIKADQNSANNLQSAMETIVNNAEKNQQLVLLRAHPDLAGKLAVKGNLTAASTSEQANADLDNCTQEEFDEFQNLNEKYRNKFGFPFILAVRGYYRKEILKIFRNRLNNDVEREFREALQQVHRIASLRLHDIE